MSDINTGSLFYEYGTGVVDVLSFVIPTMGDRTLRSHPTGRVDVAQVDATEYGSSVRRKTPYPTRIKDLLV